MRCIWKAVLPIRDRVSFECPTDSRILTLQLQDRYLTVWFLCDPEAPKTSLELAIVGTGHTVPDSIEDWTYLATVQQPPFVWHVFLPV
jgi:hypothetical protein